MYLSVLANCNLINSDMYLREVYSNLNPQPSDFTSSPVHKPLRHLPFFKDAYDSTKAEFEKLNDKSASFVSMFDINLKKAFNDFVDKGGKLNASKMYEMNVARKIVEALAINRYELPRFIAKELEKAMETDAGKIDELLNFIPYKVISDPKSGRVVVYSDEQFKKMELQPQMFVGEPGKAKRNIDTSSPKFHSDEKEPKRQQELNFDENNDWDNPTDAELDAERQEAERISDLMRADQETARMLTNRSPEAIKLANKIRQAFLLKRAKIYGDTKANQMLYSLEQNTPDYFIKKANMDIMGIESSRPSRFPGLQKKLGGRYWGKKRPQ